VLKLRLREERKTMLEPDIAAFATRQIAFRDGRVVRDEATPQVRRARAELEVSADSPVGGGENVKIREERG
jgi:hypothetical protein